MTLFRVALLSFIVIKLCGCSGNQSAKPFVFDTKQTQAAAQLNAPVETELTTAVGVTIPLVLIPSGSFIPRPRKDRPDVEASIPAAFYMSRHEITQAQYAIIMDTNPSTFAAADAPVEQMRWADAVTFCKKLGTHIGRTVRLPTELEWEYACRAGTSGPYYSAGGDEVLTHIGWFKSNTDRTRPVGKKLPNPWGLFDTLGNVAEWCADELPAANDGEESLRVSRGGSWLDEPIACRTGSRALSPASFKTSKIGFRILVELK